MSGLREKRNADIRRFLDGLRCGEAEALSEMHRSLKTRDPVGLFLCDPRAHCKATGLYWNDVLAYVLREGPEALPWRVNNGRLVRVESKGQSVNDAMQTLAATVWTNKDTIFGKGIEPLLDALNRRMAEGLSEKAEGVKVVTEQPKPAKGKPAEAYEMTDEDKSLWMKAVMAANARVVESLEPAKEQEASYAEKLAADHWGYVDSLFAIHGVSEKEREVIGFHYKSAMVHGFKHGVEFALGEESENE